MTRMIRNAQDAQTTGPIEPESTARQLPVATMRNGVVLVSAMLTLIALYWLIGAESAKASAGRTETDPECASLARVVAGRSHSILDGDRYRATERQAYAVCVSDPAAFRRIVRSY